MLRDWDSGDWDEDMEGAPDPVAPELVGEG
jgi:hypothetical protein